MKRTRSAQMRDIRSLAKELRLNDEMKMLRQEKDNMIEISGAMNDDRSD